MAPPKDHAKSRKRDLPYVINSLNILLYDTFKVKLIYIQRQVFIFCNYAHIKIGMVIFCLLIKYSKKVGYQNTYLV